MRFIFSFFLWLTFLGISAQDVNLDKITSPLWDKITDVPNELSPVYILLADQVDIQGMRLDFVNKKTPLHNRAVQVVTSLKAKAAATQQPLLDFLASEPLVDRHGIQAFWATNVIKARVNAATIKRLSLRADVGMIELILPVRFADEGEAVAAAPFVPNGREPGLTQMNAHKLWEMGYTGAGRIVMTVDSGVDWLHPSLVGKYQGIYFSEGQSYTGTATQGSTDCDGHGTRVTGNMVGLDRITNDTIGVAFNARWIGGAHAFLEESCSDATSGGIQNFQFALDPDNNSNTTDDIPDVVNNSWGGGTGCFNNSTVANVQNSMVAAGISVVWAAGNDGPDNMTINSQSAINLDLVNSFSIGALQINNNSVAGFSSRGPSPCNGSGPVDIKPEVMAHGVNVRSCDLNGGYTSQNGTSFAAPYVSGAVALLKEAFPTLSGEEINLALYFSATDLGVAGEDNTYGNGLINCLAAFNYLVAEGNTPVDPNVGRDALMVELDDQSQICGDGTYSAIVTFENGGQDNLTSVEVEIEYIKNGVILDSETINWTGSLATNERATVAVPERTEFRGGLSIVVTLTNPNSGTDLKPFNNRLERPIKITKEDPISLERLGATAGPCSATAAFVNIESETAVDATWYVSPTANTVVGTGLFFETPAFPNTFTFYADIAFESQGGGISDLAETDFEYTDETGGISFDVCAPTTLKSVKVFSETGGLNLFQIRNNKNGVVKTLNRNLVAGENIINWNTELPVDLNYRMLRTVGNNIAAGTGANISFPYSVGGVVFLHGSTSVADRYDFFYDWEIAFTGACGRIPVEVVFGGATEGLTAGIEVVTPNPSAQSVVAFNNGGSTGASYFWDFGDGTTSTDENPNHTYTEAGDYTVVQSVITSAGCSITDVIILTIDLATATSDLEAEQYIDVFPNPTDGTLNINFSFADAEKIGIQVSDMAGKLLLSKDPISYRNNNIQLDLQSFENGAYFLLFQLGEGTVVRKIVKINK